MLCETFGPDARARLKKHGLLIHVPGRGRWPSEWRVSARVRERLALLPGGSYLNAI